MNKKFLITLDTEGDNLWTYKQGEIIDTKNTEFLPRFQDLCEEFGFKPTWLVNYEMVKDNKFVQWARKKQDDGKCEIGMHIHAWNTPPLDFDLPQKFDGQSYLIEYPENIMRQKFETTFSLLCDAFGKKPTSHRSGRWAMNQIYYDILVEHEMLADCSVTPHISWSDCCGQSVENGSDYSAASENPYFVNHSSNEKNILELPVTIRMQHDFLKRRIRSSKNFIRETLHFIKGRPTWMRPDGFNIQAMIHLAKNIYKSKCSYCMFMIHSSELMPGGSPTFKTDESIEFLYKDLRVLFAEMAKNYEGQTVSDFATRFQSPEVNNDF